MHVGFIAIILSISIFKFSFFYIFLEEWKFFVFKKGLLVKAIITHSFQGITLFTFFLLLKKNEKSLKLITILGSWSSKKVISLKVF